MKSPPQETLNSMTARRPQGSDPKAGATSPQARAPAYSDGLSQLEKDVAEIKDGTVKEVLEKLRGLSDDIEEINKRQHSTCFSRSSTCIYGSNLDATCAARIALWLLSRPLRLLYSIWSSAVPRFSVLACGV
ncbi:unnamed protein product [Ascophyllum nodosum]